MKYLGKRSKPSNSRQSIRLPFLLRTGPDPELSASKRVLFWVWNGAWLTLAALVLGMASLLLAPPSYRMDLFWGYLASPAILTLNLLPPLLLTALLYGLTGRAWLAYLITALPVLGLSFGNFYKLAFRDDPVMVEDLLLLGEAGKMAGNYNLFLGGRQILTLAAVVVGVVLLALLARGKPRPRVRVGLSVLTLVGALALFFLVYLNDNIYAANVNSVEINQWSATELYASRGFLYPFLHSAGAAAEEPPENYSEDGVDALLADYEESDIPEDQKVNIVGVMLEAYNDFTKFGMPELAQDVYQVWHQLEAEGYSGNLVTNIFAGGTVDTERCFLTGCSDVENYQYHSETNSYVWYFRDQGYTTEGLHPSNEWFYSRVTINPNLGFENYWFMDNYFRDVQASDDNVYNDDADVALDDVFFPELLKKYQEGTEGDKPYFNFSVSYQGHGPYNNDVCWWGEKGDFVVDDGTYTEEQQYILDNYFGSIQNTNENLKMLTDYFRADSEPVILVLFGDHNPWMGDSNSVYHAMGIDFDMSTQEGFLDYYSTRYIIWANDAAKEVLGCDFQGEGPDISPCFLMSQLFELCGWDGPAYMQAIEPTKEQVPVVHSTSVFMVDGVVTGTLNEEDQTLVDDFMSLQYDWRHRFVYG